MAKNARTAALPAAPVWSGIGTVVGSTSTSGYKFILRSLQAKLGDIVATQVDVPGGVEGTTGNVTVWGRITSIDRFNPFFPAEAAQELADQNINFMDTVLSGSRDHLEAEVLILGTTVGDNAGRSRMSPLTYPVRPSAQVLYPDADTVRALLTGDTDEKKEPTLRVGSLIARADVEVSLKAKQVVSRHLAILAMTGGGKTVAARRIMAELIRLRYPLVIFDPHGDYLGFYEKRTMFPTTDVKIFYPAIQVRQENLNVVTNLITKMGRKLSEAQQQFYYYLLNNTEITGQVKAVDFIQRLIDHASKVARKKRTKDEVSDEIANVMPSTMNAVSRSLQFVLENLQQMENNNERLRGHDRFGAYKFEPMPDPSDGADEIVRPGQVSIFYLAGYDHLNQSAIVSIVLEALFAKRATLSDRIPPFQAVVEEAHNFIPSRQEGTDETPSLPTIRKVITEGRKFGTGLILISQRPSRLDETTLAQCNSFLVLRLVNPRDKSFVRSVMENLSESDAGILQTFGPGQGIVSGQAVRFPLLVQVDFDEKLVSDAVGDEDFLTAAADWKPNPRRERASALVDNITRKARPAASDVPPSAPPRQTGRRKPRAGL